MAADETVHIDLEATDEVSGPARAAIESLDDLGSAASGAAPKVKVLDESIDSTTESTQDLERRLALAERRIKSMGNEALKSAAKIQALQKKLDRVNRAGSNNPFGGSGKKGGMFGGITAGFKFSGFLKLIMIPTILDAVGAVATLGSALGAMGAAAVGGLAPLGGLLAAYPGMMAAIGQGYAVMSLGFKGLGGAIAALNDPEASPEELAAALKDLPPNVQRLAKEVSLMNEPFKDLKYMVGDELAPGFVSLTKSAREYIPLLRSALVGTAQVMSTGAASLGAFLNQSGTKSDVKELMGNNTKIIQQLIRAALPGIRALLNVVTAAGPMIVAFSRDFANFMEKVASSSDNRMGLTDFFAKTYEITKQITGILSDLSAGLFIIFKQGTSLGGEMGDVVIKLAQAFRTWAESTKGQSQIAAWFTMMKPIIWEVGYLIRDIAKALGSVSMDGTVLTTLQTLRNDTLPALTSMLQAASGQFLPTIAKIIGTVAQIMVDLQIGPAVLKLIAGSLEIIAGFIQSLPGPMKSLLGYAVTFASILKFGGILGFFKMFGGGAALAGGGAFARSIGNITTAVKGLSGGAFAAGEAVGNLAMQTKAGAASMASTYGPAIMAAALIAMGVAAYTSITRLKKMREETAALNAELKRTNTTEAFTKVSENLAKLKADLADNQAAKDSIADLYNPSYWLRADTWGDAGKYAIKQFLTPIMAGMDNLAGIVGMDNPLTNWFTNTFMGSDDQRKLAIAESQKALADSYAKSNRLANSLFGTNQPYSAESPELKRIQEITEALGGLPEGFGQAQAAVTAYNNVNYESAPAVKALYDSLTTLNSTTATATERTDAYSNALNGLNTVLRGTGRDAEVQAAKGLDSFSTAMDGAVVKMKNGKLAFDATSKSNWGLHDALMAQAETVKAVAVNTMEHTKDVDKATQAYKRQYDMVVNKLSTGLDITTKAARKLADQYMATPTQINTVFKQPGFKEFLETAPTYKEIKQWIEDHPINVKMGVKKDKALRDPAASLFPGRKMNLGASVNVKVKGNNANAKLAALQAQAVALSAMAITPTFKPVNLDSTLSKSTDLFNTLTEMPLTKEITITTTFGTKGDPPKALGGPVTAGQRYLVGEVGPEVYVSRGGTRTLIGTHGPERRRFPADGHIIPNHELPPIHRESVLASVNQTPTREHGGSTSEQYDTLPPIQVFIDTINADSDVDIEMGIERGIRNWFRNERERR